MSVLTEANREITTKIANMHMESLHLAFVKDFVLNRIHDESKRDLIVADGLAMSFLRMHLRGQIYEVSDPENGSERKMFFCENLNGLFDVNKGLIPITSNAKLSNLSTDNSIKIPSKAVADECPKIGFHETKVGDYKSEADMQRGMATYDFAEIIFKQSLKLNNSTFKDFTDEDIFADSYMFKSSWVRCLNSAGIPVPPEYIEKAKCRNIDCVEDLLDGLNIDLGVRSLKVILNKDGKLNMNAGKTLISLLNSYNLSPKSYLSKPIADALLKHRVNLNDILNNLKHLKISDQGYKSTEEKFLQSRFFEYYQSVAIQQALGELIDEFQFEPKSEASSENISELNDAFLL